MTTLNGIYDVLSYLEKRKAMLLGNDYTFQSLDSIVYSQKIDRFICAIDMRKICT
jgi:hypothetical protein